VVLGSELGVNRMIGTHPFGAHWIAGTLEQEEPLYA
jgi:hypothetical protein